MSVVAANTGTYIQTSINCSVQVATGFVFLVID